MKPGRRIDRFAVDRWIDALEVPRLLKSILRCLVTKVDSSTGKSHRRFPIFQAAIAWAIGYSKAQLNRGLDALERLGLVIRRAMRARSVSGHWRQLATDYELVLPESCWRNLTPVAESYAAREFATYAPRIDDAPTFDDSFDGELSDDDCVELCVRGKVKVQQDKPSSWDVSGFDDRTIPGDEVPANVLETQIVDAASIALDRVPEMRRFIATNAIYELKRRAREVALTICHHGLTAARGCGVVRQWVDNALANDHQVIHSGAHALNILRIFIKSGAEESERTLEAARERGLAKHRAQFEKTHEPSGIAVNRVCGASEPINDYDEIPYDR